MINWLPINTAPSGREPWRMFTVIAINVKPTETSPPYTSDPYCVWREKDGSFARWPHNYPPTHWAPVPDYGPPIKETPLWLTLANNPSLFCLMATPQQYAEVMRVIASNIPKFRVSGSIDFTAKGDVVEWLLDQAEKASQVNT